METLIRKIMISTYLICMSMLLLTSCTTNIKTSDLNMNHPTVIDMLYETEVLAIFCGDDAFEKKYSEDAYRPGVYLVSNKHNKILSFKRSTLYRFSEEFHKDTFYDANENWQNKLSNECGIGKKYPYIYWFTIKTTKNMPHDKDKQEEYLKNYEAFKQQILNNRSLTVSFSRPAFLIGENLIAENPSTLTFNEEQYQQLKTILESQ